jgi:hypothetical protein
MLERGSICQAECLEDCLWMYADALEDLAQIFKGIDAEAFAYLHQ